MPDLDTPTAEDLATVLRTRLANRLAAYRWLTDSPVTIDDWERPVVDQLIADGLAERANLDGFDVVRYTAAGWAWHRENDVSA